MMQKIDANAPIGQIGAQMPRSLGIFERFGLDYCCQGRRTLADACDSAGIELKKVLDALAGIAGNDNGAAQDWTAATMTALADHIESTHHVFARDTLARLSVLVPKVAAHHGTAHPHLHDLERVVARLREDMLDHMIREDRVLFPWLRRLDRKSEIHTGPPWSVRRPIDCMVHDHDEVGRMLREIKDLTNNFSPPDNACASFRAMVGLLSDLERDTHVHVHKENNILFPAGVRAEEAETARRGVKPEITRTDEPACP